MQYLVDTNVFLHTIDPNIYGVAVLCKDNNNGVCVTDTIVDELDPGYYRECDDASSRDIFVCVNNLIHGSIKVIELIKITDVEGASKEFKKIRERFYGWMTDAAYLHSLIEKRILTIEDIKKSNFRNKDLGECELVAIAKASLGDYWLITNDHGKVYGHPHLNIFEIYANDQDVTILSGRKWIDKIGYKEE